MIKIVSKPFIIPNVSHLASMMRLYSPALPNHVLAVAVAARAERMIEKRIVRYVQFLNEFCCQGAASGCIL
jgi:hypothetical protein